MNEFFKAFFYKITPLWIIAVFIAAFSFGSLIYLLFQEGSGEMASGILAEFLIAAFILYLIDRRLVKSIKWKILVFQELVAIILCAIFYLYSNRINYVKAITNKSYFLIVYDNNGLNYGDFKKKGLFEKGLIFENDSVIHLNNSLHYKKDLEIIPPESWGGYGSSRADTILNREHIYVEIYSHNYSQEKRDSIVRKTLDYTIAQKSSPKTP